MTRDSFSGFQIPSTQEFDPNNTKNDPSPAELRAFLSDLIASHLSDSGGSKHFKLDGWIDLIFGLSQYFFQNFPAPRDRIGGSNDWFAEADRISLATLSLDLVSRVLRYIEGVLQFTSATTSSEQQQKNDKSLSNCLFARLLCLDYQVGQWISVEAEDPGDVVATTNPHDHDDVHEEDRMVSLSEGEKVSIASPAKFQRRTRETIATLLHVLGHPLSRPQEPSTSDPWKTLQLMIDEVIHICQELPTLMITQSFPIAVALFSDSRIVEVTVNPEVWSVPLDNASDVPLFLAGILSSTLPPIFTSCPLRWPYLEAGKRMLECTSSTFRSILSQISTSTDKRFRALLQILHAMKRISSEESHLFFVQMLSSTLKLRLRSDPTSTFLGQNVDLHLITLCSGFAAKKSIRALLLLLESFYADDSPSQELVLQCSNALLDGLSRDEKSHLMSQLSPPLRSKLSQDPKSILQSASMGVDPVVSPPSRSWRWKTRELLESLLLQDALQWMEDDDTLADEFYVYRVMEELNNQFSVPDRWQTNVGKVQVARALSKLLCLISGCSAGECFRRASSRDLTCLDIFIPIFHILLKDDPVSNDVHHAAYRALRDTIEHTPSDTSTLRDAIDIILQGLGDGDRSVRMNAGSCLIALCKAYDQNGAAGLTLIESLFSTLYAFSNNAVLPVNETLLTIVGGAGRLLHGEPLGQAVCFLIAQLGRTNPILKGTAYLQLLAIAERQHKTIYAFLIPYMPMIAPFLVMQMCSQPNMLIDFGRLVHLFPKDFLSTTLNHTLPRIFTQCDEKVLRKLSADLERSIASLFQKHSREILAAIFLQSDIQTQKSLDFLVTILQEVSNKADVRAAEVVRVCLVPLLAELVVAMGDESRDRRAQGLAALHKVERIVNTPGRGRTATKGLPALLKQYMLGIISDIHDMLQDVHGKKNVVSKQKIIRSIGDLVRQIGPDISQVGPQIMATFQTMIPIMPLAEVTLTSWHVFLTTLVHEDLEAHAGPTSAAIVSIWPTLPAQARSLAVKCLAYIVLEAGPNIDTSDIVDLSGIPELSRAAAFLADKRGVWNPKEHLRRILERCSNENVAVASQALKELHVHMAYTYESYVRELATGDVFDPLIGQMLVSLFSVVSRDGEGSDKLKNMALQCLGVLGAVDPDRCDLQISDQNFIVSKNFEDTNESIHFVLHLISDLLVGVFRSTSDMRYQTTIAYTIQELLRHCGFTRSIVMGRSSGPLQARWSTLSRHVVETITPFLGSHYTIDDLNNQKEVAYPHPIYPNQTTYREWIQTWTASLISRVVLSNNDGAKAIFKVFRSCIRNKDVAVAHHLLPHLILTVLLSGTGDDVHKIREELLVVLEDQVSSGSSSAPDKRLLSAQAVFNLLDHLNHWVRIARQSKGGRGEVQQHLSAVDGVLSNINEILMARAALQSNSYPRALMNFEQQVVKLRDFAPGSSELPGYYERMHEIYAHLDEPDGMEGISSLILAPSLEHQIRQHESTGKWTSAQSCWEVRLQQGPNDVQLHIGLLRCLRNLGHYDTLRTHVQGVLTRKPEWEAALAGFYIESAWVIGAWDEVQGIVDHARSESPQITLGRLLLAVKNGLDVDLDDNFASARSALGSPIVATGNRGIYRSYEAMLDLHLAHDLQLVHSAMRAAKTQGQSQLRKSEISSLIRTLELRLDSTLPTFRAREPVLSMRRTALGLLAGPDDSSLQQPAARKNPSVTREIGRSWLASAKLARNASQWQTAYSAMLQARQSKARFSFIQSAKLLKATGEPLRALQELENSMRQSGLLEKTDDRAPSNPKAIIDLTDDEESIVRKAKAHVLRARWMHESQRYETSRIISSFERGTELLKKWEGSHFYMGKFFDDSFKELPTGDKSTSRGTKMHIATAKLYAEALKCGSKHVYQTVPRLLTIWLDWGEINDAADKTLREYNQVMRKALIDTPAYKWYTAFPQIVSRIGHPRPEVYAILADMMHYVLTSYPEQALWFFMSAVRSKNATRSQRGRELLEKIRTRSTNSKVTTLINDSRKMTEELLNLCDFELSPNDSAPSLRLKQFPSLEKIGRCSLIIPLQQSMTATLPPSTMTSEASHKPFPPDLPTFNGFGETIHVMKSLARPRKLTIQGSDGREYSFLGKPKDDLRKDARLMDFNSMINTLLRANSESRRRRLYIRTYGVVTLNEECGFIQWVPNTIPFRNILLQIASPMKLEYWGKGIASHYVELRKLVKQGGTPKEVVGMFTEKILRPTPPIFKEWFRGTFPEPKAWFNARLCYGRTLAVMSMVGFILGLGDRHGENILLDSNSGDVVHVDFNCLFDKGRGMETPERVPFRLTQNIVDGLGITGVEGVYRITSEVTMQLLKDNKDSLMSVLDAFVHDPLVEWEEEKERETRRMQGHTSSNRPAVELAQLARNALDKIEKKLQGGYVPYLGPTERRDAKRHRGGGAGGKGGQNEWQPHRTSNLVQILIQEATNELHLARMYAGWAPHM